MPTGNRIIVQKHKKPIAHKTNIQGSLIMSHIKAESSVPVILIPSQNTAHNITKDSIIIFILLSFPFV
ncbi:MAG: hypothetical protein KBS62_03795 [Oscillospiraceae bacterium]|nr:hypothetical protein [Candidatus Ruminococcus equi]